ncbi:MAG: tetratricopeptide repeat protein [Candidatus Peribacteria bacterium]|nr:MAG: tetratricopeptide repeat protein [Candidatus Peribacteria bacterium]
MCCIVLLAGCSNKNAISANDAGVTLYNEGKYEQALDMFDTAIQTYPNLKQAHYNKGLALYALGLYDQAIASYDNALQIDPGYSEALADK